MSATAALAGAADAAARPFFPAEALAAKLLEACAAGAAVGSAIELGVLAGMEERPVAAETVAVDFGLLTREYDGRFRAAFSGLTDFAELLRPWASLGLALRGEWRPADAATPAGAERLYPTIAWQLGLLFRESAEHAAGLLTQPNARVLDIGAGAAPWSLAVAGRDADCTVTAVELPGVMATTRSAVQAAGLDGQYVFVEGDAFFVGARASISRSWRTSATCSTRSRTSNFSAASPRRSGPAAASPSSTSSRMSAATAREARSSTRSACSCERGGAGSIPTRPFDGG